MPGLSRLVATLVAGLVLPGAAAAQTSTPTLPAGYLQRLGEAIEEARQSPFHLGGMSDARLWVTGLPTPRAQAMGSRASSATIGFQTQETDTVPSAMDVFPVALAGAALGDVLGFYLLFNAAFLDECEFLCAVGGILAPIVIPATFTAMATGKMGNALLGSAGGALVAAAASAYGGPVGFVLGVVAHGALTGFAGTRD